MAKNIKNIRYDILQGSFLGPLPFLIFVNDLQYEANILSPIMFTDDTSFFHNNIYNLFETANKAVKLFLHGAV